MLEYGEVVIPKSELPEYYQFQASLSDHPIIKTENGVIRYEKMHKVDDDINQMWVDYHQGRYTREWMMQYYRDIGYSLDGYEDVWGGEMEKMQLSIALTRPIEEVKEAWKDIDLIKAFENAAWDLTQESITSLDEAVELLRLAADITRTIIKTHDTK